MFVLYIVMIDIVVVSVKTDVYLLGRHKNVVELLYKLFYNTFY